MQVFISYKAEGSHSWSSASAWKADIPKGIASSNLAPSALFGTSQSTRLQRVLGRALKIFSALVLSPPLSPDEALAELGFAGFQRTQSARIRAKRVLAKADEFGPADL